MKDDSGRSESAPATGERTAPENEAAESESQAVTGRAENTGDIKRKTQADAQKEKTQAGQRKPAEKTKPGAEVQLDWANANLTKALEQRQAATDPRETYTAVAAAISECYKQRKSQQYLIYGYSLADHFIEAFERYLAYRREHNITTALKGTAFMQLATLAQDNGNFEHAVGICNKAIANGLTDGTVTGFEGRIRRIEKAGAKAAS